MLYWVDLEGIELSETDAPVWLQALPLNKYEHPIHGTIDVTPERVQRFADNVNNKVRGQDLDIDYDHKARSGEAAGWVTSAQARLNEADPKNNGLWIAVNFTKDAATKLKNKAYRYFSADFLNQWTHPASKQQFNDVLCGGALTNRPFLKDILPINLSEITGNNNPKEGNVDELRKELGLPDDATDAQILEAVKANKAAAEAAPKADPPKTDPPAPDVPKTGTADAKELAEQMKKLAEENPIVQMLLSEREETRTKLSELEKAHKLSEIQVKLGELSGHKYAITPATLETAKEIALSEGISPEVNEKLFTMLSEIAKNGVIELGERGKSKSPDTGTAEQKLTNAINKVMTDRKVDYATALQEVVLSEPGLYDAYNEELLSK